MGETEITQAQWGAVMGTGRKPPTHLGVGNDHPTYAVAWEIARWVYHGRQ